MQDYFSELNQGYYEIKKTFMIKTAQNHAKANKKPKSICFCCGKNSNKKRFDMKSNISDFQQEGIGYCLYFKTIQYVKNFLFMLFFVSFVFSLKQFWNEQMLLFVSSNNILDEIIFWTLIVFFVQMAKQVKRYELEIRQTSQPRISDYSIMLSNVPFDNIHNLKQQLKIHFHKLSFEQNINFEILDFSFCFQVKELNHLRKLHQKYSNEILSCNEKMFFFSLNQNKVEKIRDAKENLKKKITELEIQINNLYKKYDLCSEGISNKDLFIGKVFITFKEQQAALFMLDKYQYHKDRIYNFTLGVIASIYKYFYYRKQRNELQKRQGNFKEYFVYKKHIFKFQSEVKEKFIFQDQNVYVSNTCDPSSIVWNNMEYSATQKTKRRALIFFLSTLILLISCLLVLYLNHLRYVFLLSYKAKPSQIFIYNIAISTIILSFNIILSYIIYGTAKFELYIKKTGKYQSMIKKIVWKMFLNSSVNVLLVGLKVQGDKEMFLSHILFNYTIFCIIFYPIFELINFSYLYHLFCKRQVMNSLKLKYSQKYLNQLFTLPEYDIYVHFAVFIYFFYHCLIFMPFFPEKISFLVAIFFAIQFHVQKYLFAHYSSSKSKISSEINDEVQYLFQFSPLIYFTGVVFKNLIFNNTYIFTYYSGFKLLIAITCLLLPHNYIQLLFVFPTAYYGNLTQYENLKNLDDSYNRLNPVNSLFKYSQLIILQMTQLQKFLYFQLFTIVDLLSQFSCIDLFSTKLPKKSDLSIYF